MQAVLDYLKRNQARFVAELCDYLRFPSVSAQPQHKKDLRACAGWLVNHCRRIGLDARLCPTAGHPIVVAKTPLAAPKRSGGGRFGDDEGVAGGGVQARFEADLPGVVHEPSGAGAQILLVLRLRGDTGKAEVIAQFGHEAGLVAFQVIEHGLHGV